MLGADEAVRKLVEDEIVRRLPMSTRGIGGYGIVPEAERGDIDKARDRLRAGGFDGALIARVVGVEGPVPGRPAASSKCRSRTAPSETTTSTHTRRPSGRAFFRLRRWVRAQLNVYAVATEALVWSAASRTFNPQETRDVAGDVAKVAVEDLQKAGILAAE